MGNRKIFFLILGMALILFACKKEEDLTVDKKLAESQQAGIDFLNNGGDPNIGSGGGGGSVSESLEATIDGSKKSFSNFTYQQNGSLISMSGFSGTTSISFSLFSVPNSGDTIDLGDGKAVYVPGIGQGFSSHTGKLIIRQSTSTFFQGDFDFRAKNVQNANDSVVVTGGSFKIGRD